MGNAGTREVMAFFKILLKDKRIHRKPLGPTTGRPSLSPLLSSLTQLDFSPILASHSFFYHTVNHSIIMFPFCLFPPIRMTIPREQGPIHQGLARCLERTDAQEDFLDD